MRLEERGFSPKKILVTGATGFIGPHLVRRLVREHNTVAVLKRKTSDLRGIGDAAERIRVYEGDVRDSGGILKAVASFCPDAVFHLAAHYAPGDDPGDRSVTADTNLCGTAGLLEACRVNRVSLFVNASSCFVYRPSARILGERSPAEPVNFYACTKLCAEEICSFYARDQGVRSVTLRLFPVYGPGDHARRLVPGIIRTMLKGGEFKLTGGRQKWDFIHVDDVVEAFAAVLRVPRKNFQPHEVINIGTGCAISVRHLALLASRLAGSGGKLRWGALPERRGEPRFMAADIRKAGRILRWKPRVRLEEGLTRTIEWFREERDVLRED